MRAAIIAAAGVPPLPSSATDPPSANPVTPPFPYEDRLINESGAPDAGGSSSDEQKPQPDGYRATLIEMRTFSRRSDLSGDFSEGGLYAQHRRETLNWGEWVVEGAWRTASQNSAFGAPTPAHSNRFTLRQIGMPLANGWLLSNSAGLFRTATADAFSSNFRFNLPSALLTGVGNYWSSPATTLQFEHGRFTQLEGLQGLGTQRLDGTSTGVVWSQRLGERMIAGLQALDVRSELDAGRYSGWSGVLSYATPDPGLRWRAQFLGTNRSRSGQWFEGELLQGFHSTRWGMWTFDPALYWYSTLLSTGQQGLAIRHDYADPAGFWGAGFERTQNSPLDPTRAGFDVLLASANGGIRLDRARTIGFNALYRAVQPEFDDGATLSQRYSSLALYAARSRADVTDRLQLTWVESVGSLRSRLHEFLWTRDALRGDSGSWGITLGFAREETDNGTRYRPAVGASFSSVFGRGSISGWWRYARDSDQFSTNYSLTGTLQALWAIQNNWSVAASASLNRLGFDSSSPFFGSLPARVQERSLWLTLRYAEDGGIPYLSNQVGAGRGGGSVSGVVYFDDNRDGSRQGNEGPAAGVTVLLDNAQSVTTGSDGRFEFPLVRSGSHVVRIDSSTVRLPWGAANERGRPVSVEARGSSVVDLPLVKIGE